MFAQASFLDRRIFLGLVVLTILTLTSWIYLSESLYALTFGALRPVDVDQVTQPGKLPAFPNSNNSTASQISSSNNTETFLIPELTLEKDPEAWNMRQLQAMYRCIANAAGGGRVSGHTKRKQRKCHPNKLKIVVLASGDSVNGIWGTWRRGESIWCVLTGLRCHTYLNLELRGEAMVREIPH